MVEKPQMKWESIIVATVIKFRNRIITQYKSIIQLFCDSGFKPSLQFQLTIKRLVLFENKYAQQTLLFNGVSNLVLEMKPCLRIKGKADSSFHIKRKFRMYHCKQTDRQTKRQISGILFVFSSMF